MDEVGWGESSLHTGLRVWWRQTDPWDLQATQTNQMTDGAPDFARDFISKNTVTNDGGRHQMSTSGLCLHICAPSGTHVHIHTRMNCTPHT